MKSFHEGKYTLYIALALAIGHAIPLYAYSLGWFNMLLSQFFFPVIGDFIALGIAISVYRKGVGLRLFRWAGRLILTTTLLYLALLIGSCFVGQYGRPHWNMFALLTLPFAAPSFLLVSFITGLIIRAPKETT